MSLLDCRHRPRVSCRAPAVFCLLTAVLATCGPSSAADGNRPAPGPGSGALDAQLASVEKQIAAGEFGPAVDAALRTTDARQRTTLLQRISKAQRKAGDFNGASATAGHIPIPEERARARGANVRERGMSGGGTGADFTELMDLIVSTIEPESWDEVGGPGSVRPFNTGVRVDPNGLLRQLSKEELTGRLASVGQRARIADLNADMSRQSGLRLISLTRLERALADRLASGAPVLETMQRLAGLQQIRYVFVYPDEHEVVIAGPAEGWRYDESGRPVGRESGRPALHLDDLVTVIRTFDPSGEKAFGCSINTRDANLKEVKQFVETSNAAGPLRPGQLGKWLKELHKRLGMQDVVVQGVPADTRVAQVLVEADYRMKLIGVARLDGGPNIPSYFDLLKASGDTGKAPLEALRWWMTMKYAAILHSPDRNAFEIEGSSVLIQSENQFISAQGQHLPTGVSEPINRLFAQNFTTHYAELAQRDPIFADMQNIFDMGMVAALCRQEHLHERTGWDLGVFAPGGAYHVTRVSAPRVVESVMNHRVYNGRDIVVQVAGGVHADLLAVARDKSLVKEAAAVGEVGQRARLPELPPGRWWWDAGR